MNFSPRARREVTPLPPGLEAMLRGAPRVSVPGDLKVRLFAAHARRQAAPRSALWERFAFPAVATASAAAVLVAGALLRDGSGERPTSWVQIHPLASAAPRPVRVVDVEDPALDLFGRAGTLIAASPAEGP